MTTKEFLCHFPGFCVQTFDDDAKNKNVALTTCGKPLNYTKERLEELNKQGAGVFFSINSFPTGERKQELCTGVNAWFVESDDLSIEVQLQNLQNSPLKPSFIVRSKKSLHAYWLADKATKENFREIQIRLIDYFQGDEACKDISRVLRVPGFFHQKNRSEPFKIEIIESNAKKYTEEEMLKAFPAPLSFEQDDLWKVIGSIDNRSVLVRLSGHPIINGDIIEFQKRIPEGEYILVNGKMCDAWLDGKGFIGSGKRGGPTWIQWVGYYGKTKREIIEWAKSNLAEAQHWENKKHIPLPAPKEETKLRYTWGTVGLDLTLPIIKPGNFIVMGAKRGQGKTTFTYDMAIKNAKLGHKTLYINLEMDVDSLLDMFARKYAGITQAEEFYYKIPEHKTYIYNNRIAEIKSISNLVNAEITRGTGATWTVIENIISKHNPAIVFIDNLDLIGREGKEDNTERQSRITSKMMNYTSLTKIPIVLVHHYRKSNSQSDNGSDELAGSGKIGDNCDHIIKIWRSTDSLAVYPENCKTTLTTQKTRGYDYLVGSVYFSKGTFVDVPPNLVQNTITETITNLLD